MIPLGFASFIKKAWSSVSRFLGRESFFFLFARPFYKSMLCLAVFLFGIFFFIPSLFAFTVPALKAPVNDYARIIPKKTETSVNHLLRELKRTKGGQIAVLTVDQLGGETIEQASIKTTDVWQLGSANNDNGLLILFAIKERKLRIEVGQGFEGQLTDGEAARIVHTSMIPLMKSGDPASALVAGLFRITEEIYPELDTEAFFQKHLQSRIRHRRSSRPSLARIIFIIIIFIILIFLHHSGGGRGFGNHIGTDGFGGRGGFGGGGFGGGSSGGFGGGGGGFSGGGASGGW